MNFMVSNGKPCPKKKKKLLILPLYRISYLVFLLFYWFQYLFYTEILSAFFFSFFYYGLPTLPSSDDDKTPELNTILHLAAASSDDEEFVQAILRIQLCQKFVTEKNSSGNLPLHEAVNAGHLHIVKLLVIWTYQQLQDHSTGPLREKNKEENTPLHLALINKYQAVGCNLALESKYNEMAKFFVLKDPDISYYLNKVGKSPLYMA